MTTYHHDRTFLPSDPRCEYNTGKPKKQGEYQVVVMGSEKEMRGITRAMWDGVNWISLRTGEKFKIVKGWKGC